MKKGLSSAVFSLLFIAVVFVNFALTTHVFAGTTATVSSSAVTPLKIDLQNPIGSTTLDGFLQSILDGVVLLLTPVVVVMMLYSGFLFVVARGNSEKLGEAKKALMYTLIGAAIVIGAKGFAIIISQTIRQF